MPASSDPADLAAQFKYDEAMPLGRLDNGSKQFGGIVRHDLSYVSAYDGSAVPAYLYEPAAGEARLAGLIVMPGLHGDRQVSELEAIGYANRGAVVISITPSDVRPGHHPLFRIDGGDREELIQTVMDLRRAVDVVLETGRVDPLRIGYVGFSHGAALGGILSGVETRIKAYALRSGGSLAFLRRQMPSSMGDAKRETYLGLIATVDEINYVGNAAPATLLMQNGEQDTLWTRDELDAWHDAASQPKEVQWYDTGHSLNLIAIDDLNAFLAAELRLE